MMHVQDIQYWLATLSFGSSVGIDEGGLCLREVNSDGKMTKAYCEIGGIPEETENPEAGQAQETP
jgi:hypothetical protein